MAIINGVLTVSSFNPTATHGEYTFVNAAYNNQADVAGDGAAVVTPGFILIVPATDTTNFNLIPGVAHKYKLTSVTVIDPNTISGTMLWDETGPEVDAPANGVTVLISEATPNYKMALPASDAVYVGLAPGLTVSAQAIDLKQKLDTIGTDWTIISNHPTTVSGYGITDAIVYSNDPRIANVVHTDDARLTDDRHPLSHNQDWSTILNTPATLAGMGITDGVTTSDPQIGRAHV